MSFYRERILPRIVDHACGAEDLVPYRRRATEGLHGTVVEIGFGSGLNVEHYPPEVTRVLAVEPSSTGPRLAAPKVAASPVPVEVVGLDGESLPLADESCDAALSTFTLCTVPDVATALGELLRVLKPGGRLHFLEHGLSPDHSVARWQHRIEPLQKLVAGGCHLTREPAELVRAAGFGIERSETGYASGPRPWNYVTEGVAVKAA